MRKVCLGSSFFTYRKNKVLLLSSQFNKRPPGYKLQMDAIRTSVEHIKRIAISKKGQIDAGAIAQLSSTITLLVSLRLLQ